MRNDAVLSGSGRIARADWDGVSEAEACLKTY